MKKNQAEILTIGDELLKGQVLNSNAKFLGAELNGMGFTVIEQTACQDAIHAIVDKLATGLARSELIILSGGLGPTPDDVTRDALASFFRVPLVFSPTQYRRISKYYRRRQGGVPDSVRQEAMFPKGAIPLINRHGIALGFVMTADGSLVVVLPGVPSELERMFGELVVPLIRKTFRGLKKRPSLIVKIVGRSEPEIMERLGRNFVKPGFEFGIYPNPGEVTIRIQSRQITTIRRLNRDIRKRLGKWVHAYENRPFSESVGRLLVRKKKTLAVAESCTGGLLSYEIVRIPGASKYFKNAVVTYSNEAKHSLLGIDRKLIKQEGAVSERVARGMACSVKQLTKASFGLAVTGVAGPSGGSKKTPVGLVYIALSGPKKTNVWEHHFWGTRVQVQQRAVMKALEHLWDEIK